MMFALRKRRVKKVRLKAKGRRRRSSRHRRKEARTQAMVRETAPLPPEVMDLVFSRLPTLSLLRFTAVCKQWRDAITARVAPAAATESCVLMLTDGLHLGKLSLFNSARQQWHALRLSVDRFPFAVAASGSLVCLSDRCFRKHGTYGRVAICDPVRKLWHELPPLRSWSVIQAMTHFEGEVKILATNSLDEDGAFKLTCAELFHQARWRMVSPPGALLVADCAAVFLASRFVYLAPDYSLVAFDITKETWIRVAVAAFSSPLQTHKKLFVCDGALFLLTIGDTLVIWRLSSSMEWTEVAIASCEVMARFFEGGDGGLEESSGGYSSLRYWRASGDMRSEAVRVWAVGAPGAGIFVKNSVVAEVLVVELGREGAARWRWVELPHHVGLSARPFSFSL